jgi:long-subunit fatty acid transport protein
MKKIYISALLLLVGLGANSQSLGYQDLAQLFSQDDLNGSARFTGMSGAFGAVGGDVSAVNINPAGIAIFNYSAFSGTFNNRNTTINSEFTGNNIATENQFFNLSHAGAVLVFKTGDSDWSKFALGANYRITKDFSDGFSAFGNNFNTGNDFFRFDIHPATDNSEILFNQAVDKNFNNNYSGEVTEMNFAFSAVHDKNLYLGVSLNFYELNFLQESLLTELNTNDNRDELLVDLFQQNIISGTGFSANLGAIYKIADNFRLGVAYKTPTWYTNIIQDTNYNPGSLTNINDNRFGDTTTIFNDGRAFEDGNDLYFDDYALRTPGEVTLSGAYVFGKKGLISVDYTNKYFSNINLSSNNVNVGDFNPENQFFQNELRDTYNINIGTEWRFNRLSLRGGYRFEQAPDTLAIDSDDLRGYSLGAGYDFGNFRVDFAFSNNNRTAAYNFYPQPELNVESAELNIDNRIFTTSVSFHL